MRRAAKARQVFARKNEKCPMLCWKIVVYEWLKYSGVSLE
jgi:hypothetical protein